MNIMDGIFVESSESQGLLYDRYYKIPKKVEEFLNFLDDQISSVRKEGPTNAGNTEVSEKLEEFKEDIKMEMKTPRSIKMDQLKSLRDMVLDTRKRVDGLVDHLAETRRKLKFGDNVFNGIFAKPKIYQKGVERDDELLYEANKFMRDTTRSLDWVEKITLDLMNLADQDLNLLSIISRVYFKRIAESYWDDSILSEEIVESDNVMEMEIDESYKEEFHSWFEDLEENDLGGSDNSELLNETIPDEKNKDEEYFPIFCIAVGFDLTKGKFKNMNARQKQMTNLGKLFKNVTLGDHYSHTLISFDTSFENMIHFLGTGFNRDNILTGSDYEITDSIYVTVSFLTKDEIESVKAVVKDLEDNKDDTGYNINQILGQLAGKKSHKDKNFVCSCAVGYILSKADVKYLPRDYAFIRPEDMTILPRSFYVIQFKNRDDFIERKGEFERRVKQIYEDNINEIREYNNILPKTMIETSMKQNNSFDTFLMNVMKKINAR